MIGKIGFLKSAVAICFCAGASLQGAELRGTEIAEPQALARITSANYCFAHSRALEVERMPPSYLVLKLKMQVVYRNSGTRPMILPLGRELAVYTSLHPGAMKVAPQPSRSFEDTICNGDESAPGQRQSPESGHSG